MMLTSSVASGQVRVSVLEVTSVIAGAGVDGATVSLPFRATSPRSKDPSTFAGSGWCSSTAIVLSPLANSDAGTWYSKNLVSSAPDTKPLAGVVALIWPGGRLSRTTSTPLTYTAAPSSRFSCTLMVLYCDGFETLMCLTKYCVSTPVGRRVASSPSPQPNSAGPVGHELTSNAGFFQVVPRSWPEPLYDQVDPVWSSVATAGGGGVTDRTAVVAERLPVASRART